MPLRLRPGRYAAGRRRIDRQGTLLNTYLSETWQRPHRLHRARSGRRPAVQVSTSRCCRRCHDDCIEAPLIGIQFGTYATDQGTPDANFGAAVNGNYGFGDGCFDGDTLDVTDPSAPTCTPPGGTPRVMTPSPRCRRRLPGAGRLISRTDAGHDIYKVTREEDINIGNGDEFVPAVPPPACAGALHTVDSSGNATFPGGPGTSPYEGQEKPLCDVKLVTLNNGKSSCRCSTSSPTCRCPAVSGSSSSMTSTSRATRSRSTYGEKAGMPFVPVGIYDYTDRLITTIETDYNGLADVLLPSTNRINCPTPSGVCANLYRFVGNDPGVPGRLNPNFNPSYRTIAAEFEVIPGLLIPADLAPTQVGVTVQLPGGQTTQPVLCKLDAATPRAVRGQQSVCDAPWQCRRSHLHDQGKGFGTSGRVLLDGDGPAGQCDHRLANIRATP